jgi:hypothetical protein
MENNTTIGTKVYQFCVRNTKIYKICKLHMQGYISRILQHFATKLGHFTNFGMLFNAELYYVEVFENFAYYANGPLVGV